MTQADSEGKGDRLYAFECIVGYRVSLLGGGGCGGMPGGGVQTAFLKWVEVAGLSTI